MLSPQSFLGPQPFLVNEAHVDCGACRACCHQIVVLDDRETGYDCDTHVTPNGPVRLLKRQADGACIYLSETGCSIYEARPAVCRLFDCGGWYREAPRAQIKAMIREGGQYKRMAKEGRKRSEAKESAMKRLVLAALLLAGWPGSEAWAQQNAFAASGPTVTLSATGTTGAAQVQPTSISPNIRVYNSGTVAVFLACGGSAVVATVAAGMPVAPGTVEIIGCSQAYVAGITAGTAVTVYLTPGAGL